MKSIVIFALTVMMAYAGGIKWEKDYASGLKASKASNKPMFFVISSHTCRYCVIYDKSTLSNSKVIEKLNHDFINVIAYVDDNAVFPNDLYAGGTPTTWFIAPDGEPMFQPLMGALEPEQLMKALEIVKAEHKPSVSKTK